MTEPQSPPAFEARIGPPRILLAVLGLAPVFTEVAEVLIEGKAPGVGDLVLVAMGLTLTACAVIVELVKMRIRRKIVWVRLDSDGLTDRRLSDQTLAWSDIAWIDPHPGGTPDRLRIGLSPGARWPLSAWGALRNRLITLVRFLPGSERVVTFGGLHLSAAQAADWIARHQPQLLPPVWLLQPHVASAAAPAAPGGLRTPAHGPWIEAELDRDVARANLIGFGLILAVMLGGAGWAVAAFWKEAFVRPDGQLNLLRLGALGFALVSLMATPVQIILMIHAFARLGPGYIVVSPDGILDKRVSGQVIGWHQIEHISYMASLSTRTIPPQLLEVQLRDGVVLAWPDGWVARLRERVRRLIQPELISLNPGLSTTTASEIIETIQRHDLPVALRETARN